MRAFRHPDRPLPQRKKTSPLTWLLTLLLLVAGWLVLVTAGAMIFGQDARVDPKTGQKP